MGRPFIHDDFLLTTDAARELYRRHAAPQPIIDYHCHLPPREIAEDRRWNDLAELWLGGDHYKWRQMRWNGVDERLITGDAPWGEKFRAWAGTMEKLLGNPLFDWSQLELKRFFGVDEILSSRNADELRARCSARLAEDGFSARGLMARSRVEVACTTDDPDDTLEWHERIADSGFATRVLPTWRPDRILAEALEKGTDPLPHLAERHAFFASRGCVLADYGLGEVPCAGRAADLLFECLRMDAEAGWASQLHVNCIRNPNARQFAALGRDSGFDTIGAWRSTPALAALFDRLERAGALGRIVVYSLNPNELDELAALAGSFQKGPVPGRIQLGAAWWFNDHRAGMLRQLEAVASLGLLPRFVGMLTDSRSFLSYARHEYFRRILCAKLGEDVERGALPDDLDWIGGVVADVCCRNARSYFGF